MGDKAEKIVFGGVAVDQTGLKVYHSDFLEINPIIQALVASIDFSVPQKRSFGAHPRTKGHTIQYMVENNTAFISSATSNFQHRICFKFLESLATEYKTADLNAAKGIQLFEQYIRNQIKYFSEDSSADPLRNLNSQVKDVQTQMNTTVELALSRGEHLEKMRSKTENLEEKAVFFRKKAKAVYCTMLQENMQTTVILVGIILAILAFIGGVLGLYFYVHTQ